ncbi:Hypothetical predicted protein [Mytilus galloprovincialis]|uniref:Uncharacterized protein n=1 Tax=Mytilus galloprovincialis TaxID=29158 RepID=A0A8B6HLY9_MYTGA|nr:Hypothetical predicted protein [Mytilus galloprovincialis]
MGKPSDVQKTRSCEQYKCDSLIEQHKTLYELPDPETRGIFRHQRGWSYDAQNVGKYLKTMTKEYRQEHVTVGWAAVDNPKFEEHHYLSCLAEKQKNWPKCNLKRGRPPARSRLGSKHQSEN